MALNLTAAAHRAGGTDEDTARPSAASESHLPAQHDKQLENHIGSVKGTTSRSDVGNPAQTHQRLASMCSRAAGVTNL